MAIHKDFLNLAGEYRVCSELLKRSLFATITYGNKKGVDIFAIGDERRVAVVEVKTSNSNRFVTSLYQKYPDENALHPDFWVLHSIRPNESGFEERFFILTHDELATIQAKRSKPGDTLTYAQAALVFAQGVDNVLIEHVKEHEGCWGKIVDFCNQKSNSESSQSTKQPPRGGSTRQS